MLGAHYCALHRPIQWHTTHQNEYGVALVSRIDSIIGLFCKRALRKKKYSAEETYDSIDPTDSSRPIGAMKRHLSPLTHIRQSCDISECVMSNAQPVCASTCVGVGAKSRIVAVDPTMKVAVIQVNNL